MNKLYKCRHFSIRELVPPHVYKERHQKAWELLDVRLLQTIDALRDEFGFTTINNWYLRGGRRKESGLRTPQCATYSQFSQHTFGRAADMIFRDWLDAGKVRRQILENPEKFPLIDAMELGVNWLHIDVRNCNSIKTFYP